MTTITTYKSKIASRYIPVDAEQIGLKIPESECYFASIKHDGHLAFLSVKKGKAKLFDRNGEEVKVPAVTKAAESLKEDCVIAGELCVFKDDQPTSHREVNALLDNPDKADFRFGAFDVLEVSGAECAWEAEEKFKNLSEWLKGNKEVFAIEQNKFESRKDIIAFFKSADENNAEGLVVKLPNGTAYKVKKVHHLDLVVLGYAETNGEQAGVLRELLLGCALENNQFQIITKCGSGFSEKERTELVKQLEPLSVSSEYTEVSGAKTAFIFVKPEVVVEISCLDFINENSNGPIKKALLNFDKSTYTVVGNASTLSVISPNFTRLREDKKANEKDAGTLQAYALCEPLTAGASAETGAASEMVLREVFTKSGKGGTAVRKFVALKTNKEKSGSYSPFVVVYSDFSAGRKTPLEQEIFLCENEKEAAAKITELKEENIKKGWEQFN
jgi:ATP-dependent DNA ligase